MYSNNKKGFSILDLLVKIIFAGLFIFILIWLFNKKIPNVNMTPFYSNVFRENIKYMQDAGEAYFTDEKMPTEIGESIKLSLAEMEANNIILPFVDKDGKECNKNDSYVSITKMAEGYELRTNLVCGKESNYIVKTLGCHTYCPNGNCNANKSCSIQKITQYQFKKLVNGTKTNYSCNKGYTLKGAYCYKTTLVNSKDATIKKTETVTYKKPATVVKGDSTLSPLKVVTGSKDVQLKTTVTSKDTEVTVVKGTKEVEVSKVTSGGETQLTVNVTSKDENYSCTKTKTENQCKVTDVPEAYSCDCATRYVNGMPKYTCNTCYRTIKQTTCKDVKVEYTGTCTRTVKEYSCPSGTTRSTGSGSSLKCYKAISSYTCPSGTTRTSGSESSLKCYKSENTYSCPSGTTKSTGSGSSLKCYKTENTYSCPSGTDVTEGSGASLKCYALISGKVTYKCTDAGYKLDSTGKTCVKTEQKTSTEKVCKDKGYKLENGKCNLYKTTKVKATATKKKTSYYTYKWSEQTSLAGYTSTGKTRTIDGKEVCE